MAKPAYFASLGLVVLGHYGILAATGLPYWEVSSWQASNSLYGRIPTFDGIFWQCMSRKEGGFSCNNYGKPTIYVDVGIQACRGLMITACILSFIGIIGNILVLDCSTILDDDLKTKRIVTILTGICCLVAFVCTLGATAYYGWKVTYEYYSPLYKEREWNYQYGPCLYTGWISMALVLIAGCILTFGACKDNGDNFGGSVYSPSAAWENDRKANMRTEYL